MYTKNLKSEYIFYKITNQHSYSKIIVNNYFIHKNSTSVEMLFN